METEGVGVEQCSMFLPKKNKTAFYDFLCFSSNF